MRTKSTFKSARTLPSDDGGRRLTELTSNDAALLSAMIGTIGTIWGIAFVAFAFLFDRWKEYFAEPSTTAEEPSSSNVFTLFLWVTVLSFASIVLSVAVFVANSHELLVLAWVGFLVSTGAFLWLTFSVYSAARRELFL